MPKVNKLEGIFKRGNMPKVLIADEISEEGITLLKQAVEVDYRPQVSFEEMLAIISNYDGLLVRSRAKVTKEIIEKAKRLKIIGRAGVGVDNIDLKAATEAGILVINSPEGNTASAAEHALALMFALARKIPLADASVRSGKWDRNSFIGCELFNKTIGIIGLGKIGSRVAQTANALGMKVLGYDPLISAERANEINVQNVGLDEIWAKSDFISIHTPKTRETTHLIDEKVLAKIKPGVRIINAARGGIINEAALCQAIHDGKVAGAALDVFEEEPLKDSPLKNMSDKVVLTPHLGASTHEAQFNVAIDISEQIRDYLSGGHVQSPVNLPFMRPEILKSLGKYVWLAEAMGSVAVELCGGTIKEIEIKTSGNLSQKDTRPMTAAVLRGAFYNKVETVTYVNAHLIARNHGIVVKEVKEEDMVAERDELSVTIRSQSDQSNIAGTVLAHDEAIITRINEFPINLTPQKYMLFTSHKDKPGMVAKVANVLGGFDINISTMAVARKGVREEAVMVMTLDDSLGVDLMKQLTSTDGIHMAKFVTLEHLC
jgi:D-3-phosphoglycerate dehydrogenase